MKKAVVVLTVIAVIAVVGCGKTKKEATSIPKAAVITIESAVTKAAVITTESAVTKAAIE